MSKTEDLGSKGLVYWINRPQVIMALGSFCFGIAFFDYFVKMQVTSDIVSNLGSWINSIEWFGLLLGYIIYMQRNVRQARRQWGKIDSIGYILTIVVALIYTASYYLGAAARSIFDFLNIAIRGAGGSTTFALQGLFTIGATFRSLRMKSIPVTISVILFIVVIFGQATLGEVIWSGFTPLSTWLQNVMLGGSMRALQLTAALGAVVMGIRVLLWYEKDIYGGRF
jgi:hypothetical protein